MATTDPHPAIPITRLSVPFVVVLSLLVTVASGVWYLAITLADIRMDLEGRTTDEEFEGHEGRIRALEDWRIEHEAVRAD